MKSTTENEQMALKFLSADNLHSQLKNFTRGMSVTKGNFELLVKDVTVEDIEWNHMDQMHRHTIHNTYEKNVRIAAGRNFAVSLTQWSKWPLLITVTDVYVAKGLFYQSLTIAGMIFIHSIIRLEKSGDNVLLNDEWYIASHKIFKWVHAILNRKLYKLNVRLQEEDEPVRQGRLRLRKKGYHFKTDFPNYYNSNQLGPNTIYPPIEQDASINVDIITEHENVHLVGGVEFIFKKNQHSFLIWPAACPHEGGPLFKGEFCLAKVTCPWHGLQFAAAELSIDIPIATKHGFEYKLLNGCISINKIQPGFIIKDDLDMQNTKALPTYESIV